MLCWCTGRWKCMDGTEFMTKSLSSVWVLPRTKPYYGIILDLHGHTLKGLAEKVETGKIKCTQNQTFSLTLEGLEKVHEAMESVGSVGNKALPQRWKYLGANCRGSPCPRTCYIRNAQSLLHVLLSLLSFSAFLSK